MVYLHNHLCSGIYGRSSCSGYYSHGKISLFIHRGGVNKYIGGFDLAGNHFFNVTEMSCHVIYTSAFFLGYLNTLANMTDI